MTVRQVVGTFAPKGWGQTLIWAAKVAVHTFIGAMGTNALGWTNLAAVKAAGIAAGGAAASIVINKLLSWAGSP